MNKLAFDSRSILAKRFGTIPDNPIAVAMARAAALRREGRHVVDFSVGEPDFETPQNIQEAAIAAMRAGQTRYTASDGTPELKQAVRLKFQRENGLEYGIDQISVASGAKHVIATAMQATLDAGDEVIVPAPYWTTYPEVVRLCGGTPVIVQCGAEKKFKLTPDQLSDAITDRTKWLILNSPSNPSGMSYSADELAALAQVILANPQMMVLADDMYEHIIYGEPFRSIAEVVPAIYNQTLTVNGVSKTYAMTGWRVGYAGGPAPLIRTMRNILSQMTSNPCSISQAASIEALNGNQDEVTRRRGIFAWRRDLLMTLIGGIPALSCEKPDGAFYAYVNCAGVLGKTGRDGAVIRDDAAFASYLLETKHVATVSGGAFGLSPYLRLSYAISEDDIREGCRRLAEACAELQ